MVLFCTSRALRIYAEGGNHAIPCHVERLPRAYGQVPFWLRCSAGGEDLQTACELDASGNVRKPCVNRVSLLVET